MKSKLIKEINPKLVEAIENHIKELGTVDPDTILIEFSHNPAFDSPRGSEVRMALIEMVSDRVIGFDGNFNLVSGEKVYGYTNTHRPRLGV